MTRESGAFKAEWLLGRWHVVASSFPMWVSGGRRQPTFTYSELRVQDGSPCLNDEVSYLSKGTKPRIIKGINLERAPGHFQWRGRGLLWPLSSLWRVLSYDPQLAWLVVGFSSTMATPEGLDVLCKSPMLDEGVLEVALEEAHHHLVTRIVPLAITPKASPAVLASGGVER